MGSIGGYSENLMINVVCRKCGKTSSKQEYDESRFCKSCGTFLQIEFQEKDVKESPVSAGTENSVGNFSEDKLGFIRAVEILRQRVTQNKEYNVIPEAQHETKSSMINEMWIWNEDYNKSLELEKKLCKKFEGKKLEDSIAGKVVSNDQGECYEISEKCSTIFNRKSFEESRQLIISNLKILYGIGPVWEQRLKEKGYKTIEDLQNHPIWKKSARVFMKIIETKDVGLIQNFLWGCLPKSDPLLHFLSGFCDNDEDFAIIDIETLGLSERPIVLLGIAHPDKNQVCTKQYLLRDIQDEPSAIWSLVSQLESNHIMITYNGRSFDIPYIKQRLAYYGLDASLENPHFDLLHFTRRALRHKLKDCRLDTVETYLGIKRDIDIPGALVPQFYDTYLKTKNVGPLVAIVEHNKQDLVSLGTLFSRLFEEWNYD
ncbi:MAG: ribonuclease H-like domain-containing protein [Candidatus Bathyarchaeota archaeon]